MAEYVVREGIIKNWMFNFVSLLKFIVSWRVTNCVNMRSVAEQVYT